jgi:hypothetical protein
MKTTPQRPTIWCVRVELLFEYYVGTESTNFANEGHSP